MKLQWLLPAIFSTWVGISVLALSGGLGDLPVEVTNIFSLVLIPFFLLTPLLKPLGLTMSNAAYGGPTDLGTLVGTLIFNLLLFGLGKILEGRR